MCPRIHRRKSRLVKLVEKIHIPVDEWVSSRLGKLQSVKEHVYKLSRSVDELRGELRAARASEMRTIETLVRSTPRRRTRP